MNLWGRITNRSFAQRLAAVEKNDERTFVFISYLAKQGEKNMNDNERLAKALEGIRGDIAGFKSEIESLKAQNLANASRISDLEGKVTVSEAVLKEAADKAEALDAENGATGGQSAGGITE